MSKKCNWLTFYSPFRFASQAFAWFAFDSQRNHIQLIITLL